MSLNYFIPSILILGGIVAYSKQTEIMGFVSQIINKGNEFGIPQEWGKQYQESGKKPQELQELGEKPQKSTELVEIL